MASATPFKNFTLKKGFDHMVGLTDVYTYISLSSHFVQLIVHIDQRLNIEVKIFVITPFQYHMSYFLFSLGE